jgi:hypothetical protein
MTNPDHDPFYWPKTVEVGGREYVIGPQQTMRANQSAMAALANEAGKISALKYALNMEMEAEELELMGIDPEAEDEHR